MKNPPRDTGKGQRSGCSLLSGHQRSTQAWLNGPQGQALGPRTRLSPRAHLWSLGGPEPAQAFVPCPSHSDSFPHSSGLTLPPHATAHDPSPSSFCLGHLSPRPALQPGPLCFRITHPGLQAPALPLRVSGPNMLHPMCLHPLSPGCQSQLASPWGELAVQFKVTFG